MVIAIAERHDQQTNINLILSAVTEPTIIVLGGTLGAGKTSLARTLLSNSGNPAAERAMLLNDSNLSVAQADASVIPEDIRVQTLDGCACCSSNDRLLKHVGSFIQEGRKLIIIEGSGTTDPGQLKDTLSKLFKDAKVLSIAVVDSEHIQSAPSSVLHTAVLTSDLVLLSHAKESATAVSAAEFVNSIRGSAPDHIQVGPGDITAEAWDKLLTSSSPRAAATVHDEAYRKERAGLAQQALAIIGYESTTSADLAKALSESPVLIDRAKGFLKIDGQWKKIQYELKDGGKAVLSITDTEAPSSKLLDGRPHLFLLSTHGSPRAESFLKVGTPDFSKATVAYYLKLYTPKESLQRNLAANGVPVSSDGDALFMSACGLFDRRGELPADRAQEFVQSFVGLLHQFVSWRLGVTDLIKHETGAAAHTDTANRKASLAYTLSWALVRFGGALQNKQFFGELFQKTVAEKPASMLIQSLSQMTSFEINNNPELTASRIEELKAFTALGKQFEGLTRQAVLGALENLAKLKDTAPPSFRDNFELLSQKMLEPFA